MKFNSKNIAKLFSKKNIIEGLKIGAAVVVVESIPAMIQGIAGKNTTDGTPSVNMTGPLPDMLTGAIAAATGITSSGTITLSGLNTAGIVTNTAAGVIGTTSTSAGIAAALSDETGTGSVAFSASPTFTTNITTPLLIGGTAVGSNIIYKSTTGIGTVTGIAHQFVGGTDGATVAQTILNNGNVGVGTTNPEYKIESYGTAQTTDFVGLTIAGNRNYASGQFGSVSMNFALPEGVGGLSSNRPMAIVRAGHESSTTSTEGFLSFYTRIGGVVAEKMRLSSAGNLGVGSSAPLSAGAGTKTIQIGHDLMNGTTSDGQLILSKSNGVGSHRSINCLLYTSPSPRD